MPIEVFAVDVESSVERTSATVSAPAYRSPTPASGENQGRRRVRKSGFRASQSISVERPRPADPSFISGILPLNDATRTPAPAQQLLELSEAQKVWRNPQYSIHRGISTQLFNIHTAEYHMNQSGTPKVTLYRPNRHGDLEANAPLVKLRWL